MTHAKVVESFDKAVLDIPDRQLSKNSKSTATISGGSSAPGGYAVVENGSNNLVTLRYRLKDVAVRAVEQAFKSGDQEIPAGSLIFPAQLI